MPDARCEQTVRHEIAFSFKPYDPTMMALHKLNALFQTPPLIVEVQAGNGTCSEWAWQQPDLPLSSLLMRDGDV